MNKVIMNEAARNTVEDKIEYLKEVVKWSMSPVRLKRLKKELKQLREAIK